jgi:hypothetical protein
MIAVSCKTGTNEFCKNHIYGSWIPVNPKSSFNALIFNEKKQAIFTSKGDTIYRYNFHLKCKTNQLALSDIYGGRYVSVVSYLSKDSLSFSDFFGFDEQFIRMKRKKP